MIFHKKKVLPLEAQRSNRENQSIFGAQKEVWVQNRISYSVIVTTENDKTKQISKFT